MHTYTCGDEYPNQRPATDTPTNQASEHTNKRTNRAVARARAWQVAEQAAASTAQKGRRLHHAGKVKNPPLMSCRFQGLFSTTALKTTPTLMPLSLEKASVHALSAKKDPPAPAHLYPPGIYPITPVCFWPLSLHILMGLAYELILIGLAHGPT